MPDKNLKRPPLSRASLLRVRPPHRPKRPRCLCVLTGRNEKNDDPPLVDSAAVFDWATYEQAKPHFRKVFEEFRASGKSLQEFATFLIRNFSEKIRPYLKHFLKEVQAGKLYDQPGDQDKRSLMPTDEMSEGPPMASQKQDRPAPPRDPNRPPLIPGQTELTQEQKDYFLGQEKTLDTLQRLTKKFNLLDDKRGSPMSEQQAAPGRTWPRPRIDPNHPKLEPGQTELTPEQKDFLRGRLKTLAMLQRLAKKFKPELNPEL